MNRFSTFGFVFMMMLIGYQAQASKCGIFIEYRGLSGDRMNRRVERLIEKEVLKLGYKRALVENDAEYFIKLLTPSFGLPFCTKASPIPVLIKDFPNSSCTISLSFNAD